MTLKEKIKTKIRNNKYFISKCLLVDIVLPVVTTVFLATSKMVGDFYLFPSFSLSWFLLTIFLMSIVVMFIPEDKVVVDARKFQKEKGDSPRSNNCGPVV